MVAGLSGPSCPGNVPLTVGVRTCGSAPEGRAAAAVSAAPPSDVGEVFESNILDLSMAGWDKDLYFPSLQPVTSCDVGGPCWAVALSAGNDGCTCVQGPCEQQKDAVEVVEKHAVKLHCGDPDPGFPLDFQACQISPLSELALLDFLCCSLLCIVPPTLLQ